MRTPILLAAVLALGLTDDPLLAQSVSVVLRVVDQAGAEIPQSRITVGGNSYTSGSVASLPLGVHLFQVHPSVNRLGVPNLYRTETHSLLASSTAIDFEWITSTVTLRVVDQHGSEIPASRIGIPGVFDDVWTGAAWPFPITDRSVYPTIGGTLADGYNWGIRPSVNRLGAPNLNRTELRPVLSSTTAFDFEWITSTVTLRVVDQHGAEIPASMVGIPGVFDDVWTGATWPFPITDRSVYPTIGGTLADGYNWGIRPSVNRLGAPNLNRTELRPVLSSTTTFDFEWITSTVTLRVVDQHGAEIPASRIGIPGVFDDVWTGATWPFPINDRDVYPTIGGALADGYSWKVAVGIAGSNWGKLARHEVLRVLETTQSFEFPWHVIQCAPTVLDADGDAVPGSYVGLPLPFAPYAYGVVVGFPITDNAAYPTITGDFANGYPILVRPGDVAPAAMSFDFEVTAQGHFEPQSFEIAGNTYRLGCITNLPPTVDAGPNRTLPTSVFATSVISGVASDPDGQTLSYTWLEGSTVLFGPAVVGTAGDAPMPLGSIPVLAIGQHELTLAVTDGVVTMTDNMSLTIGNSPPTAACTGSGTYQAGVDSVVLAGTVGDFDGDSVTWSWWQGATLLASGQSTTPPGGMPTALPSISLLTGSGAGAQLGVGAHVLELRVDDGGSTVVSCAANVVVVDDQAPRLAPLADRSVLWPPNHEMVTVTIEANASDAAGGPVAFEVEVLSSEDALKDGSGNTIPDFTTPVIDGMAGRIRIGLRAERAGRGPGRTYTVRITAIDQTGNRSTAGLQILAPHDRGH